MAGLKGPPPGAALAPPPAPAEDTTAAQQLLLLAAVDGNAAASPPAGTAAGEVPTNVVLKARGASGPVAAAEVEACDGADAVPTVAGALAAVTVGAALTAGCGSGRGTAAAAAAAGRCAGEGARTVADVLCFDVSFCATAPARVSLVVASGEPVGANDATGPAGMRRRKQTISI